MSRKKTLTGVTVWEAAKDADLEEKAKDILLVMADEAGLFSWVQITERDLAAKTGHSRTVVWYRLHKLEELGWLEPDRQPFRATVFTLRIPDDHTEAMELASLRTVWPDWLISHDPAADHPPYSAILRADPNVVIFARNLGELEALLLGWDRDRLPC